MATRNPSVLEPHARHIGAAMLFINRDGSWSVGPDLKHLVKVSIGDQTAISDQTFGFSAIAAEPDGKGGWRLFVRSDQHNDIVVEVAVDAQGKISPASVKVLSAGELFAAEEQLKLDLNDNGGFGADSVLLEGGAANLYVDAFGAYQVGVGSSAPTTLMLGATALTDEALPPGWEIVEAVPSSAGYTVYALSPDSQVFAASFGIDGGFAGGKLLSAADLDALESGEGLDIDGDFDVPATEGWTQQIRDPALRRAVESALDPRPAASEAREQALNTNPATISYSELVAVLLNFISARKQSGSAPITADELASLQALAARGKAAFATGSDPAGEYLAYVFGKMVDGSDANRFFNGGEIQRSELGNLRAGSSIEQFEKLVSKWILGGDMPSPATAGDTATGNAQSVRAAYAKSSGQLFVDGVALADVNQGTAGDCYAIAVFGAVAGTRPSLIESMIVANPEVNGTRSWGVRFYDQNGKPHWVTVNDMLPVRPDDNSKLAYAGPAGKELNGEIWLPLLEKAYAQANALGILPRGESTGHNSYAGIEGGFGDPLAQLTPGKVTMYSVARSAGEVGVFPLAGNPYVTVQAVDGNKPEGITSLVEVLKTVINAGKVVWIGVTTTQQDSFGNKLLVGSHAHYAIDAAPADPNNDTVMVYNPWGLQALPEPAGPTPSLWASPVPYTLAQLVGIAGLDFAVLDALPPG